MEELEDFEKDWITKMILDHLESVCLDDLFEFESFNKVTWLFDPCVSIELLEGDSNDYYAILCITGYDSFKYHTLGEALYGFVSMFLSCASDLTDAPPTGQLFARQSFGG